MLPPQWLANGNKLASSAIFMDLSYNRLHGSIPAEVGGRFLSNSSHADAAAIVLDPMSGPGLCGGVPNDMNIVSATRGPLHGMLPGGACPGRCLQLP